MIKEEYVSFETAKLLKEKGFKEGCSTTYTYNGLFHSNNYSPLGSDIFAPTQQMACRWLREVCKQSINLWYDGDVWSSEIYRVVEEDFCFIGHFQSYEEAVEAAIKYCLENLI